MVMCFFGDGAVNEGYFHEALNLASLWKLPVVFILENNLYGMGSHIDRTHATGHNLYLSADEYNIPATQIDGMDVLAVIETAQSSIERTRSGGGPVLIEANSYRFHRHFVSERPKQVDYLDHELHTKLLSLDPLNTHSNENKIDTSIVFENVERIKRIVLSYVN